MFVDRTRFLTLVTTIAAGACSPSPGPQVKGPEAAPSSAPSGPPTGAPTGAPSASTTTEAPPTEAPPTSGGTASEVDKLVECGDHAFGPCGEGNPLDSHCRNAASGLGGMQLTVYFTCAKTKLPAATKLATTCEDAGRKCGKARLACEALDAKASACQKKVDADCAASAAVVAEQECWKKCIETGPKPATLQSLQACTKKCGEPETAQKNCVDARRAKDCKPVKDKADACHTGASADCNLASCSKELMKACLAAYKVFDQCAIKGKG